MFIGREKEIAILQETYEKPGFQMTVINEPIDKAAYESLLNRNGLIDRKYEEVQYLYFSLSGFSGWVEENADPAKTKLLTLKNLYS